MTTNVGAGAARRALALCAAVPVVAAMCWLGCSAAPPPTEPPPQVDPVSVPETEPAPEPTSTPAPAGDGAGATASDAGAPPASGKECTAAADCPSGQMCDGPEGCDARWTCQAPRPCTRDLVPYCGCDGKTIRGSSRCAPAKYSRKGECAP